MKAALLIIIFISGFSAFSECDYSTCPVPKDVVKSLMWGKPELQLGQPRNFSGTVFRIGYLFGDEEAHKRTGYIAPERLTLTGEKTRWGGICFCRYSDGKKFSLSLVSDDSFKKFWRDTADEKKWFYGKNPFDYLVQLGLWGDRPQTKRSRR